MIGQPKVRSLLVMSVLIKSNEIIKLSWCVVWIHTLTQLHPHIIYVLLRRKVKKHAFSFQMPAVSTRLVSRRVEQKGRWWFTTASHGSEPRSQIRASSSGIQSWYPSSGWLPGTGIQYPSPTLSGNLNSNEPFWHICQVQKNILTNGF